MRWSTIERDLRTQHGPLIAGVDEVGRGPLAGPVVACAIVMPPERRAMPGINDSKQLSAKTRERLVGKILANAIGIGIGAASVREIDRVNIRCATALALGRALRRLSVSPDHVLLDGTPLPELGCSHEAIVDGDARCHSIAAASVLAKLVRDRLMTLLARRHPAFGWDHNMGYGTREHLRALERDGPTAHHRKSFMPVVQLDVFGH